MLRIAGIMGIAGVCAVIIAVRLHEEAKPSEIIARAIKAHGGAEKLEKLQASIVKTKGQFHGYGEPIDYCGQTTLQLPNRSRTEAQSKFGKYRQVVNDDKEWIELAGLTRECGKEEQAEAREQLNAAQIAHLTVLTGSDYKLSPLAEESINDRTALGVRVQHKGFRDVNLFFDKETGLLLKMQTRIKDPTQGGAEIIAETLYEDYKEVDGLMTAHKYTLMYDGRLHNEGEVVEASFAEKLDDDVFAKP